MIKISSAGNRSDWYEKSPTSPTPVIMQKNEGTESDETFEKEFSSELPLSEVLSAKDIQKLRHERRRETFRKSEKKVHSFKSWLMSGGLLGI